MTDRHIGFIVTLEETLRADDAQHIIEAIRQLRNVASVVPIKQDMNSEIAHERALRDLREQLRDIVWPPYEVKR